MGIHFITYEYCVRERGVVKGKTPGGGNRRGGRCAIFLWGRGVTTMCNVCRQMRRHGGFRDDPFFGMRRGHGDW